MTDARADILLVEDNPNDIKLTLHAFKTANLGNTMHVARDGVEALDYLFGAEAETDKPIPEKPKVILLDLKLPRIDGHEVLKRIKADPRTRAIPVVVLTSSKEQPDVRECYELGVNSYIVKPVNFERFASAVAELGMYWLLLNHPPNR